MTPFLPQGTRVIGRDVVIEPGDPSSTEARAVLAAHLAFAHGNSPPEAVFAMDSSGLMASDVSFFCAREEGAVVAVGALRHLSPDHAEIKSMHTAAAYRGRGYARAMLEHLLETARERGYRRVSLETGNTEAFAPARGLYAAAGFTLCGRFGDYPESGFSTFMTLELT
jgi:putative acetyltransferase